jgi:predicted glycoside hydrolase/deacetylase ChbG (UPF0249 family)
VRYFSKFYGQWSSGETHLEWIGPDNLLHMLQAELRDGCTELGCHPGYVDPDFESIYNLEREAELQTLCDQTVRQWLAHSRVALVNFQDAVSFSERQGV